MNKIMMDAFKALENIDDELVAPIKRVINKDKKVNESKESGNAKKVVKEKIEKIDISGKDMYERGKAYYYAHTGDIVDIDGKKFKIDQREHKIGYGDTIDLIDLESNKPTTISKEDFVVKAQLLDENCKVTEAPKYDLGAEHDSRKSFYGKAKVDVKDDGTQVLYSYGTPVCRIENGKVTLLNKGYLGWASSQTTLRHVKEFLKQNGFEVASLRELAKMYPIEQARADESLKESVVDLSNKEEVSVAKEVIHDDSANKEETIVDVDAETVDELKDSYVGNAILRCPVCRTLIYKKPDDLKKDETKDIYNIEEECPHCHSQEGFELVGQVAELTPEEAQAEKETTTGKENDVEEKEKDLEGTPEAPKEGEEEKEPKRTTRIETEESLTRKFMVEDIDESRFDKLVNQYLVSTYNNVESYKTTSGKVDNANNIIVLEGTIKYKSGKEKATTFMFEAKSSTKNGRLRFVGVNETLAKSRNAFSLFGRISKSGCLRCESMHYSYGVKVLNENKLVKGKVEIKEKKSK